MAGTIVLAAIMLALAAQSPIATSPERSGGSSAGSPILFVPNTGQTDAVARYTVSGPGHSFYFTPDKVVLDFQRGARGLALELRFRGANPHPAIVGERRTAGRVNYLTGSERHTNLATYSQLRYRNLWPGIDMVLRGPGGTLKYEFLVRPGADPRDISLAWAGADSVRLSGHGALAIGTPLGTLRDAAPRSVQGARNVHSRYVVSGSRIGFALGAYDPALPLTIDPGLVYSTFLGGAAKVDVDDTGNAYVTGKTAGLDFPTTPGAYDTTPSTQGDAFVTKFAVNGALVYSTFIGGEESGVYGGTDQGLDIAVDDGGAAYIVGTTTSSTFPVTPGAYKTSSPAGPRIGFVAKLNSAGSSLDYATYLGQIFGIHAAIEVDGSGNAYVSGDTDDSAWPTTPGAFNTTPSGLSEFFVTKLNATGSALVYSTFIGNGVSLGLALDSSGSAYVTGQASTGYPTTPGAYDTTISPPGSDAVVTKLSPAGDYLVYSTFLGRNGSEQGADVAVDADGNAYVTGFTNSSNFPTTPGAYAPTMIGAGFVTKLNAAGSALVYSTYTASTGSANRGIDVDETGKAYVTGEVGDQTFTATVLAFDDTFNGGVRDGHVMELSANGAALDYATYLGGSGNDFGTGIAVDGQGNAHVAGFTDSPDFPLQAAIDNTVTDGSTGFVTKLATLEPTGYPRPMSATPARFALAIAYRECTDPNELHGPPLAYGSCGLPVMASDYLTVGTFDANGLSSHFNGYVRFGVISGNPAAPPDEADVGLVLSSDDIRTKSLSDYAGELRMSFRVRITDRDNTPVGGGPAGPGTTVDVPLGATFPCMTTADPSVGSTCAGTTTIEAIAPGAVTERMRSVWQLDRVRVFDGGPDGVGDTVGGNTVFATAGLFVP